MKNIQLHTTRISARLEFFYCEFIPFWESNCAAAIRKILITKGKPARRVQCCPVVSRSVRYHFRRQLSLLTIIILRALFRVHKQTKKNLIIIVLLFGEFAYYSQSPHFRLPNSPVFRKCARDILRRELPSLFVLSLQHANFHISFFTIAAYYFTRRIFRHNYIIFRKIRRFLQVRMLSCFRWAFYFFVTHRPVIYINYTVCECESYFPSWTSRNLQVAIVNVQSTSTFVASNSGFFFFFCQFTLQFMLNIY